MLFPFMNMSKRIRMTDNRPTTVVLASASVPVVLSLSS